MPRLFTAFLILLIIPFSGCDDNFQYSPNEISLKENEKNLNVLNISRIQSSDTLRFLFISDLHHSYEELGDFVNHANSLQDISFVAIGGDLTNFGLQEEYRQSHGWLKLLKMPSVAVIGNHDLLGNGEEVFKQMYGKLNFSFTVNGTKLIFVNSNSREYDFKGVPDLGWLKSELADSANYNEAIVIGHCPPFDADFDPELQSQYAGMLASHNIKTTLYGHSHSFKITQPYNDGVSYVISDDMSDRSYVLVKVFNNFISTEQITF
jgi:Icc protein